MSGNSLAGLLRFDGQVDLSNALQALVERAVKHSPTSLNMHHTLAVLVTGEWIAKVWDMIQEIKIKGETATAGKIDGLFKADYRSVLFFSDESLVSGWGNRMPMFAEGLKMWVGHASGMLHYNVWTALELEGHGANLQHIAEARPISRRASGTS
ncbi:hypothetical protein JCM24511_02041 [Saitozyma sp. JCM 24511]|nr:hypothetical protein JCM24511_02041 [Saitozyma sp. JCM 24511]